MVKLVNDVGTSAMIPLLSAQNQRCVLSSLITAVRGRFRSPRQAWPTYRCLWTFPQTCFIPVLPSMPYLELFTVLPPQLLNGARLARAAIPGCRVMLTAVATTGRNSFSAGATLPDNSALFSHGPGHEIIEARINTEPAAGLRSV